jgi:hypothetical protein
VTVTLYKNSQTEGDKVYNDLWQFFQWKPDGLFSDGFTSEKAEFIIPDSFKIIRQDGKGWLEKGNCLFELFTNRDGKPGIRGTQGSYGIFCNELKRPGEEPPKPAEPEKPKSTAWVPQMIDGEWEIY